jgi:hypothetical protein
MPHEEQTSTERRTENGASAFPSLLYLLTQLFFFLFLFLFSSFSSPFSFPPPPLSSPQALESNYVDKKCPFTGNVSIRGRILTGIVKSLKMKRTCVIRRDYLHYIKKYVLLSSPPTRETERGC